uniref:Uncharacterized protein n=1 Tax=Candidatus Kentrum sp. LPFa TaxID=2126335 RepID=A0A450W893_9GAMM|nr:MAG: hypothetical protein BECKLPF1236A_GA0070988_100854 [Candidatus Kentron sp. LPFa]VFK24280.1 MAG: hypothetical protein BECKLPF1236C_GA0070990_100125 [Candidatus Kentron sp. LPFa]
MAGGLSAIAEESYAIAVALFAMASGSYAMVEGVSALPAAALFDAAGNNAGETSALLTRMPGDAPNAWSPASGSA